MKAVILAGGEGTRLWPLSTPDRPKQFQKLFSEKTLLEEAIDRVDFLNPEDIYLGISNKHLHIVKELCPQIPTKNIIIEPAQRDTASCIGLACAIINRDFPDEPVVIIYADHHIPEKSAFQEKIKIAAQVAEKENTLNIVEIIAREPSTNFGYVKIGKVLEKIDDTEIYEFIEFKEKPDIETAKKFLEEGSYLWNTGIYVWKAKIIMEEYKKIAPETYEKLTQMAQAFDTENEEKIFTDLYSSLPKISIDYAIMEKVDPKNVRIIKADFHLSDLGTWETIWSEQVKDAEENILRGKIKSADCKGCLIYSDKEREILAIGLEDLIVVETEKGLLISKKGESKRIKDIL